MKIQEVVMAAWNCGNYTVELDRSIERKINFMSNVIGTKGRALIYN